MGMFGENSPDVAKNPGGGGGGGGTDPEKSWVETRKDGAGGAGGGGILDFGFWILDFRFPYNEQSQALFLFFLSTKRLFATW